MIELNGTSLVFALSFLLFIYLLDFALWKPIGRIKEERNSELQNELENAAQAEAKTKQILKQVAHEISSVKKAEHDAIEQIFEESKLEEQKEEDRLKAEMERFKQRAIGELTAEKKFLLNSVEEQAQILAGLILEKVAPEFKNLPKQNDREGAVV